MSNKSGNNAGYKLVYDRVSLQLEEKYFKEKSRWKHQSGKPFRFCKMLFWITSVLSLLAVALNLIIIYFAAASKFQSGFFDQSSFFKNNIYIVIALFLCYSSAMIFQKFKKRATSSIINFAGAVILAIQYFQIAQGGYEMKLMYYYIPAWLLFLVCVIMFIIVIGDKKAVEKAVNKEINRIYTHFSESEDEVLLPQEDWDNLLLKYETQELYKEKNIKKAKKALNSATEEEIDIETE